MNETKTLRIFFTDKAMEKVNGSVPNSTLAVGVMNIDWLYKLESYVAALEEPTNIVIGGSSEWLTGVAGNVALFRTLTTTKNIMGGYCDERQLKAIQSITNNVNVLTIESSKEHSEWRFRMTQRTAYGVYFAVVDWYGHIDAVGVVKGQKTDDFINGEIRAATDNYGDHALFSFEVSNITVGGEDLKDLLDGESSYSLQANAPELPSKIATMTSVTHNRPMPAVHSTEEFLALIDDEGKPKQPFTVGAYARIGGLETVTCLPGVFVGLSASLMGLEHLETLEGMTLSEGCRLTDLTRIISIETTKLPFNVTLGGLVSLKTLGERELPDRCILLDLRSIETIPQSAVNNRVTLSGLSSVRTLNSLTVADSSQLEGLTKITNFYGLNCGNYVSLGGCINVEHLVGGAFGVGVTIGGLVSITSFEGLETKESMGLFDTHQAKSFKGLKFKREMGVTDCTSIETLNHIDFAPEVVLDGLVHLNDMAEAKLADGMRLGDVPIGIQLPENQEGDGTVTISSYDGLQGMPECVFKTSS